MKKSVAIFDIDYTVFRGDTMFYFVKYGISKKPSLIFYLPVLFLYLIGYVLKVVSTARAKEVMYYPIKFMDEKDLDDFFTKVIEKRIYPRAKENIRKHKENGDLIIMITASPYAYTKYFEKYGYANIVIGTTLESNGGKLTNRILGENCKGEEKVKRIYEYLNSNDITIDYEQSYGYSDSHHDMPIMRIVKNKFKVNKFTGETTVYII